jgi:predicted negative regulator of RcsB-dependent stress response
VEDVRQPGDRCGRRGSLAVVGWQGWNWYQREPVGPGSGDLRRARTGGRDGDAQKVKAAAGELAEKFGDTAYASLGAMVAAKQSFEAGDLKTAKAQLSWAADNGKDEIGPGPPASGRRAA